MGEGLIQTIVNGLKNYQSDVLLVENNDRFLYREDVIEAFNSLGVVVNCDSIISQRIAYELREPDELLVLVSQDNSRYLEDIQQKGISIEFSLSKYLQGYHIPSVVRLDIPTLEKLFNRKQFANLNRRDTQRLIQEIINSPAQVESPFMDISDFVNELDAALKAGHINWKVVIRIISKGILATIGKPGFEEVFARVNEANVIFQRSLETNYQQKKNSSAIKKPKIVSKILDYLSFNYPDNRIALIVIDGMAYWQYELLSRQLPGIISEEVIYSWIPSITQLSRQAIFRGDTPRKDYQQGPLSEEKLWQGYWKAKGFKEFEIGYQHENIDITTINPVRRLALVYKELDDKIHSSTDYRDLLSLTRNWMERSQVSQTIQKLLGQGFTVFLTSDHGNIQSKGWRSLRGREKLGTNKSGSRSERHIEYPEEWLHDEFVADNPELAGCIASDRNSVYFINDYSFSRKTILVTHGGAHILEVLIPFITIRNDG